MIEAIAAVPSMPVLRFLPAKYLGSQTTVCYNPNDHFDLRQAFTNWPPAQIPITKLPKEKIPNEKTPAEKIPTEKRPAENIPAENNPADKTPVLNSPADNHPDEDAPGGIELENGGAISPISNNMINALQIIICAFLRAIVIPPSDGFCLVHSGQ